MSESITRDIVEKVGKLPLAQQRLVLNFVLGLEGKVPKGVPGKDLVGFAGCIEPADLQEMSKAIDEACEKVDRNAW